MTLTQRLRAQLAEVASFDLGWNLEIARLWVAPTSRDRPGLSVFALTKGGVQFEERIQVDDNVAQFLGEPMH
jgi:hypothetical protein